MIIKLNWWLGLGLFTLLFSVFALLGWVARDHLWREAVASQTMVVLVWILWERW